MKISLSKIPKHTWGYLYCVGESINEIDISHSSEPMYKAFVNILIELQPKLCNKYKQMNIDSKKQATLALKYYHAFTLDWYLSNYINKSTNQVEVAVLSAFKLKLNQALH